MNKKNGMNGITVKLRTSSLATMRQVALKAFNGKEVYAEPGLSIIRLKHGDILELYGPGSNYPDYLFKKSDTVVGYKVADLNAALQEAEQSGMQQITSGLANGCCYRYFHLSDPEGNLVELQEAK